MSKINYIIRPITNGMYDDTYTVYYSNGTRRRYTINGAMLKAHFEFIQNATVESFYSKWTGVHKHDIFWPATEPTEEPAEEAAEEPAPEEPTEEPEEASENYIAWCGMIESDVITEEYETLSEAVDEVETKYDKNEMKAAGVTFCKLLCNSGQWLECLEEKKIEDIYYFDEEDEEPEPTADEIGTALMAELNESLDYFKRVIYDYLDGTRYESDINGDLWGCHECWLLLFHMNTRLKTGGKTPFYALENEFCTLSECFEEIRCKYKYGDKRTIENILEEYNLIKA